MKTNVMIGIIFGASVGVMILAITLIEINDPMSKHNEPIISQNDLACGTVWRVQLNSPIDKKILESILRNEIAELGSIYDIPERDISIEDLGDKREKIT
ncbi:MAG: hypothetical protein ACT4NJ_05190, partial [Nitrosopumilaceae archaeon]